MKNARQQKILEIIEKYDIDTQDTLIRRLGNSVINLTTYNITIKNFTIIN